MSPDEIATISNKLDRLTGETAGLTTAIEVLATEFRAHRTMEEAAAKVRDLTCPKSRAVDKLVGDVDALAGIVRRDSGRTDSLEVWRNAVTTEAAVDEAERGIIFKPLSWIGRNAEKIALAVAVAYIIVRLGF
jgi:hypothetical protein